MANETSMLVPDKKRERKREMYHSKVLDFIFLLNWATYIGERRTTFAKPYGIKSRCYGEHIGNLGNILGTCVNQLGTYLLLLSSIHFDT